MSDAPPPPGGYPPSGPPPGPPGGGYPPPGPPPGGGFPPPGPPGGGFPPPGPPPGGGFPPPGPPGGGYYGGGPIDPRSGIPLADIGARIAAYFIDIGIFLVISLVIQIIGAVSDVLGLLLTGVEFFVIVAYVVISEGGPLGQTLGKHLMGVKVVGPEPGPIGYGRAGIRYLARILDVIFCCIPIGLFWALFDGERRCWHDIIADTRVVVAPQTEKSASYWWNNFRG